MMIVYSLGILILLLVDCAVQQEGDIHNLSPRLKRAGEEEVEGGGDQTIWTLKNEGLDDFTDTPALSDGTYVLANLGGDAEKNRAAAASDGKPPAAQDVIKECQIIDDSSRAPTPSRNRRRQDNSDKPLICPAQPPPPSSQQEEKKPSPDSSGSQSSEEEKPDPWQWENQERRRLIPKFSYNNGICSERDYGYMRVIPVCDSGIEFFRTYQYISRDWDLRDVRPCRF